MAEVDSESVQTTPAEPPVSDGLPAWAQVWQLPVLLAGVGLFIAGLVLSARSEPPQHDFAGALDSVGMFLVAENVDAAQQQIDQLAPLIAEAPAAEQSRYWQYLGDLNFAYNRQHGDFRSDIVEQNNRLIARYYATAEELGRPLDPAPLRRYAQTLVALGRRDAAMAIVDRLKGEPPVRRYQIVRDMIEHALTDANVEASQLNPLIIRFREELAQESDRERALDHEVWVSTLEARLQIAASDPGRAIDFLIRKISQIRAAYRPQSPAASDALDRRLAPLMLQLARAYHQEGALDDAERWYRLTQQWLADTDELNGDALVGLGQITVTRGGEHVQHAMELFTQAVRQYPSRRESFADALIGRGDCAARLGVYHEAMDDFRLAVSELLDRARPGDPRRQKLVEVVRTHIEQSNDASEFERSLELLGILKPLYEPDLPPELLLDLAVTHEAVAQAKQAHAASVKGTASTASEVERQDAVRLANQEAASHYARSAGFYLQHAKAVTIADDEAHGLSLWKAGLNYDAAQHWPEAIAVYAQFIKTRQKDPLRLRAVNRLGLAFLADGQDAAAADLFLQLVREHPHSPETYDSLVPLARAHVQLKQFDAALRDLRTVVDDHPAITPESVQYRDALIELGRLLYRLIEDDPAYGVPAIERLTEAVERYGDTADGPALRFLLADAYRKSIPALDADLATRMANAEQVALMKERNSRLERAQVYYNQAINQFEARPAQLLSPLDQLYLRNAYFYQADCAFDRQHYEESIRLYDEAARRWEYHPASLVALVQKVNAYCELGQYQEAKTANDHALWQLNRIPEEKFDDPSLPMSRAHWEQWLRWTSELDLFTQAEAANLRPVGNTN